MELSFEVKCKGVLYIICSAFCFSVMNLCVRMAGDVPTIQKSFFRNFIAFMIALVIIYRQKISFHPEKKKLFLLILRSAAGTTGILCNFYAVDHLILSDASLLNKMSPFFAIIFSFILLKEKLKLSQIFVLIGAFVGSLFVIQPGVDTLDMLPALIGLLGGMSAGLAYTVVRKLGQLEVEGSLIVLFFSGFSCLVTLPVVFIKYVPMSSQEILFLLLAGLAASGGQFAITAAYQHAPARDISVFDYSQIIFSGILGFVFFTQIPNEFSLLGYIIIIFMAVFMFMRNKKDEKKWRDNLLDT